LVAQLKRRVGEAGFALGGDDFEAVRFSMYPFVRRVSVNALPVGATTT
jgi:hypothetical protein